MQTVVLERGPRRFDMTGQALPFDLTKTSQVISDGLAKRLFRYASERMSEMGLPILSDWNVSVETCDADLKPADRYYSVAWGTSEGAEIGIEGILTRNGWPFLDHGPFVHAN